MVDRTMRPGARRPFFAVLLGGLLLAPAALAAQEARATIRGIVVDAATREPVAAAQVRLRELARGELSHADGQFHFDRLAPGRYTLLVQRIGFAPAERAIRVAAGEAATVTVELAATAIDLAGIVVTGTGRERAANEVYRPTSVLSDAELRRRLGSSIAATLADQPGIAQRYNGPAAAQPVVRGLSGDRVLVLEDGQRTGDLASTSGDHAVAIEPLTAERIEVVRGPAGLLYGSNALGGVINVIREEVPRTRPEHVSGTFSAQAESVNRGLTAGGSMLMPAGPLAVRAELSGRTAADTRTPLGTLPSTELRGHNAGAGVSWAGGGGYAGVAGRDYALVYGVPGTFEGQTIPGAHEGGIEIDMRRSAARVEAGLRPGGSWLRAVDFDANYVRVDHRELEPGGFLGTHFGQLMATGNLVARHAHTEGALPSEGAFGVWGMWRDFRAAGSSTGSHPAEQVALAGFAFEELGRGPLRLELGARYDWSRITPYELAAGHDHDGHDHGALDDDHDLEVRARSFGAVSGSAAALWEAAEGWTLGASVARAFRTPSIEELYSNGPHLASYAFEIGNPELGPEYGLGTDVFVRFARPALNGEVSIFRNAIDDYIHYAPTGELDPRLHRYPVYQAQQGDALLQGAEGRVQWEALPGFVLDGNASYVRGERRDTAVALPAIPPLSGGASVRYDASGWFVGGGVQAAAAQERTAEFETHTPGYALLNLNGGLRWSAWGQLHTLTLQVQNATDRVWWDHLSRIRAVAPQPGRNIQLLYRVDL
jgi:iron complex outermembrane receptor protein